MRSFYLELAPWAEYDILRLTDRGSRLAPKRGGKELSMLISLWNKKQARQENFESGFASDAQAIAELQRLTQFGNRLERNSFAHSLASQAHRLSSRQLPWVHKLAMPQTEAPKSTCPEMELPNILSLFETAKGEDHGRGLKTPKISIGDMSLKYMSRGRFAQDILVTEGEWPQQQRYGRIDPTGKFIPFAKCTDEVIDFLAHFETDPKGISMSRGKESGTCCFCRLPLTDEKSGRSVEKGYGPVCAKNWQLPWG